MSTNRGYMLASSIGFLSLLAILGDWFCLNKHHSCNSLSPLPIRWRTLEEVQKNPPLAWFRSESYVYIHIEKENSPPFRRTRRTFGLLRHRHQFNINSTSIHSLSSSFVAFFFAFKWGFWERLCWLCNGCVILLAILGDLFCLNKHHSCNSLSPLPIRCLAY